MKKKLVIVLAMALLCIMAVGTTLTYFTDTTAVDTNTMTVGNVKIAQKETFDQNAKLLPYTGAIAANTSLDTAKNAVQKLVTVENTGSEKAYIRTLFAFEAVAGANPVAGNIIHIELSDDSVGAWALVGDIKVGGVTYFVYSFTYKAALAAGSTTDGEGKTVYNATEPSLKAIALDGAQTNEFYTNVGADGQYNILVLSQAVQTAGFTGETAVADAFAAAFPYGNNNANLEGWFKTQP